MFKRLDNDTIMKHFQAIKHSRSIFPDNLAAFNAYAECSTNNYLSKLYIFI